MGTNYYCYDETEVCSACNRGAELIHLGKASFGWKFLFQYNDAKYYSDFEEFCDYIQDKEIVDEYMRPVAVSELLNYIEEKQDQESHSDTYSHHQYLSAFYYWRDGYEFLDSEFS
jgi:hypothetical protein